MYLLFYAIPNFYVKFTYIYFITIRIEDDSFITLQDLPEL